MENDIIEIPQEQQKGLFVARDPAIVLEEAKRAAQALMTVVGQKKNPVIINKEQYLEFEDWQTVARFYGITVKVVRTALIDWGGVKGFEATAEAIRNVDGMVVSSADAMCLNDEEKWSTRAKFEYVDGVRVKTGDVPVPLFQLRSMAQTRACAKALRNILAWVVVLAGFKPTPAEEMTGSETPHQPANGKPPVAMPQEKGQTPDPTPTAGIKAKNPISGPQGKRLYAIAMSKGYTVQDLNNYLGENYGIDNSRDIEREWYEDICTVFEKQKVINE